MKYFLNLLILSIFFGISVQNVNANNNVLPRWCKSPNQAIINIIPRSEEIKYNLSKNINELSKVNVHSDSPYDNSVVVHTQGLMEGNIKLSSKTEIAYVGDDDICLYYKKINVYIDFSPTIYIASNYKKNGCMYNEIMIHEIKHVQVDRDIINKYSSKIGHKILEVINKVPLVGPVALMHFDEVRNRMHNNMQKQIKYINAQMLDERKRRQNMVDSLEEYQRMEDQNICTEERNQVRSALMGN